MDRFFALAVALSWLFVSSLQADESRPIKVLFLGDNGLHHPSDRYQQLRPAMARRGIEVGYSDKVESLNAHTLAGTTA